MKRWSRSPGTKRNPMPPRSRSSLHTTLTGRLVSWDRGSCGVLFVCFHDERRPLFFSSPAVLCSVQRANVLIELMDRHVERKVTKAAPRGLIWTIFCVASYPSTHGLLTLSLSLHLLCLSAAFGTWHQRVHFKSNQPTVDSSLVIKSTEVSDEGNYLCRISTFPSGNFDREMSLIVWSESLPRGHAVEKDLLRQVCDCECRGDNMSLSLLVAKRSWKHRIVFKRRTQKNEEVFLSILILQRITFTCFLMHFLWLKLAV